MYLQWLSINIWKLKCSNYYNFVKKKNSYKNKFEFILQFEVSTFEEHRSFYSKLLSRDAALEWVKVLFFSKMLSCHNNIEQFFSWLNFQEEVV